MNLLNERNEWLANKLVNVDSDMMFAGVVAGNNPGEVWVDNLPNPTSALVWSSGLGAFNFMGSASNPNFNLNLKELIDNEIIPFLRSKNRKDLEFSVDSESWYPAIYEFIGNRTFHESYQYVYKSNPLFDGSRCLDLSESFNPVEIDESFLSELTTGELKNSDFIIHYIEQYWGTLDSFLGKGYGYVALTPNKEIASIAISSFLFHSTHVIGVETLEEYQRQGMSSSLVSLLLKKLNDNRVAAWWDCMESNIASQKTAEKAGLVKSHRYKINWFDI